MATILKFLLSVTTLTACAYGVSVLGISMWPALFSAFSVFLLTSIVFTNLDAVAITAARIMGILSFVTFALLMLAAAIGGAFHISESNQVIAIALALMALFGCAFFLIKNENADSKLKR